MDLDEYYDSKLANLQFDGEDISKDFFNCTFDHCTFLNCNFEGSSFVNCKFNNCNISAVKVKKTRFQNVEFFKSKVIGIDWTDKFNFKITDLSFDQCTVNYSVFNGIFLKNFKLINSIANEVDFIDTKMPKAVCTKTDFLSSNFLRTDLRDADFREAVNYHIDPAINSIKGIKMSLPEALSILRMLGVMLGVMLEE